MLGVVVHCHRRKTMESRPPQPQEHDKSQKTTDDGAQAWIPPRADNDNANDDDNDDADAMSLLLAALDLASISASTTVLLAPLKRQGHYRPIGAFAMRPLPPSDSGTTTADNARGSMARSDWPPLDDDDASILATTTTTTSEGFLFRVPVAELVVDNCPTSWTTTATCVVASPRRDIEIAELYAGRPLLGTTANPTAATAAAAADTIRINHSVESIPFPSVRSDKDSLVHLCCRDSLSSSRNGLLCLRFCFALSCLLLLLLIAAMVLAVDVLQDDQP
jgi:hypothetical protein